MKCVNVDLFCSFISYQINITPLYVASEKGHHYIVQRLLEAGVDVDIARSDVSDVMFDYFMTHGVLYMYLYCATYCTCRQGTQYNTRSHSAISIIGFGSVYFSTTVVICH